jgi:hypothetical protein
MKAGEYLDSINVEPLAMVKAYSGTASVKVSLLLEQYAKQREQAAMKKAITATLEGVLDWLKSDDCYVVDKNGNHIQDVYIDGKNIGKYMDKYINIEEEKLTVDGE